jgi:hypothetical protein
VGGVKRLLDKGSMWVYGRVGCELCGPRPRGEAAPTPPFPVSGAASTPLIAAPFEGHLETVRLLIPISHPSARTTTNHRDVTTRRHCGWPRSTPTPARWFLLVLALALQSSKPTTSR